jgi:hypothetical protein
LQSLADFGGAEAMNERWSADFMSDALWGDRRFRTFKVVDDFNREGLAIESADIWFKRRFSSSNSRSPLDI